MTGDVGADPAGVGEVRLVRTFRVGPHGQLYPVNSAAAWAPGVNTAECARGRSHPVPAPGCRCGFYAYSDPVYAREQPPARSVLAVVCAHGAIQLGSRGARVSHARIEALWLGPRVTGELAAAVARSYPGAALFRDRAAMLAAFPLTRLDGFTPPRYGETARDRARAAMGLFLGLVALVGAAPTSVTLGGPARASGWLAVVGTSVVIALVGLAQRSSVLAMQGAVALGWLLTADPRTPLDAVMHAMLAGLTVWVLVIWARTGQPGRAVRDAKLDVALRRWRGRLPGSG